MATLLAGAGWIGLAAASSVWLGQICIEYRPGSGPHSGSGCTQSGRGISWDAGLWLALGGGAALIAIAVALWIRLPRELRVATAMGVLAVVLLVGVVAVSEA